ncbi:MAG TPA: aldo/keto reductase [Abditibacteriaceae bacterium]|jgi:aryl-alcohol dehydrogenase-like predicted oxidoreductase
MERRQLGRSGLDVTVLTMGCWQAGGEQWTNTDDESSIAAIRAAHSGGINFFDTAEGYGGGHSEEIVAQALQGHRDDVFIATKVGPENYTAEKVRQSCNNSLQRLQTDHIDLYQLHWPSGQWGSPLVPIEETMGAMVQLQKEGKIRAIGLSNYNSQQIEEALQYGRVDSLQPPYSLFWRPFEANGTVDTCIKHNIGIIAYSPLAQGLLTGKFNKDNKPEGDNRAGNALFKGETYDKALAAVDRLKPIAEKYGVSTGHLSLQWLIGQPGLTSVIVGARNAQQVSDNIQAAGFQISEEDRAAIDRIGRTVTDTLGEDQTNMWG